MKLTTVLSASFLGVVSFLASVNAAPVGDNVVRDVWDPKILVPNRNTTWTSGETYTVVWETADQPKEITDKIGNIILAANGIEYQVLLAWGFNMLDGQVEVTVPPVYTDDNYQIVLFGDSGNLSEEFQINGPFNPFAP